MKKVIRISKETWDTLTLIKIQKDLSSIEEVIQFFFRELKINPKTASSLLAQFAKAEGIK